MRYATHAPHFSAAPLGRQHLQGLQVTSPSFVIYLRNMADLLGFVPKLFAQGLDRLSLGHLCHWSAGFFVAAFAVAALIGASFADVDFTAIFLVAI